MNLEALEKLHQRISKLEAILGIDPNNPLDDNSLKSLPQELKEIETLILKNFSEADRKSMNSCIQTLTDEENRPLLTESGKTLNSLLGTVEKAKLILLYEGNFESLSKEVQKMSELVKYLEFPPVHELDQKLKDLLPIEENLAKQGENTLSQDEEFKRLLEAYNQSIRDINTQFIYIEGLVEKAESAK